jgi:lysophospholipase L1-like esterase
MRLMFVGDSMTIGSAGDYTWRYRMWQHLNATLGGPFRIVGPRTELYDAYADAAVSLDYRDPAFPAKARGHLAGWGEGWLHLAPLIRQTVAEHRPDVLLVSLGLIDLGFYTNAAGTEDNLRRFVAEARAARPGIAMVLLPVIPNTRALTDDYFRAECEQLNIRMEKAVADLATQQSPLLLASPPEQWSTDRHTYDGTHPNESGEHLLAASFADALHQAWSLGEPYRPA